MTSDPSVDDLAVVELVLAETNPMTAALMLRGYFEDDGEPDATASWSAVIVRAMHDLDPETAAERLAALARLDARFAARVAALVERRVA